VGEIDVSVLPILQWTQVRATQT